MKLRPEVKLARQVARSLAKLSGVESVVLFGSAARDEMRPDSDIDVALIVDWDGWVERSVEAGEYIDKLGAINHTIRKQRLEMGGGPGNIHVEVLHKRMYEGDTEKLTEISQQFIGELRKDGVNLLRRGNKKQ